MWQRYLVHEDFFGQVTKKTGNHSIIFLQFKFDRTLGFYILQIYIPLTIIVMSSWVSITSTIMNNTIINIIYILQIYILLNIIIMSSWVSFLLALNTIMLT